MCIRDRSNHVCGLAAGGPDMGSMVLGGTEDGMSTSCYFVSSLGANIPSAPPPPTSTEPIKKVAGKKAPMYKAYPE
eukprot:4145528-Prorocentrum_lima.AAC.1